MQHAKQLIFTRGEFNQPSTTLRIKNLLYILLILVFLLLSIDLISLIDLIKHLNIHSHLKSSFRAMAEQCHLESQHFLSTSLATSAACSPGRQRRRHAVSGDPSERWWPHAKQRSTWSNFHWHLEHLERPGQTRRSYILGHPKHLVEDKWAWNSGRAHDRKCSNHPRRRVHLPRQTKNDWCNSPLSFVFLQLVRLWYVHFLPNQRYARLHLEVPNPQIYGRSKRSPYEILKIFHSTQCWPHVAWTSPAPKPLPHLQGFALSKRSIQGRASKRKVKANHLLLHSDLWLLLLSNTNETNENRPIFWRKIIATWFFEQTKVWSHSIILLDHYHISYHMLWNNVI